LNHQILELVRTLRCVRQDQLEAIIGPQKKGLRFRLARLAKQGYLGKVVYGAIGGEYKVGWTVGPLNRGAVPPFTSRQLPELNHQFELVQIYVDLILKSGVGAQLSWSDGDSQRIEFGNLKIRPDAMLGLRKGGIRILLEYDRGTKSLYRLEEQIRRYREFLCSPYASANDTLVIVVSESATLRLQQATNIVEQMFLGLDISRKVVLTDRIEAADRIGKLLYSEPMNMIGAPNHPSSNSGGLVLTADTLAMLRDVLEQMFSFYHSLKKMPPPASEKIADIILER
jgi:hypothetical protein